MKRKTWRKHHKWLGIGVCFFMLMFCLSGVVLNHRSLVAGVNVSRKWLPSSYEYHDWNGGLLRGTLPYRGRVLVYGTGGMWLCSKDGKALGGMNRGLPVGADYRQIRSVVLSPTGQLFAASGFGLYEYDAHEQWQEVPLPTDEGEKLNDLTLCGDTLVAVSRSHFYVAPPPYRNFQKIQLKAPTNYDNRATAFRTVWLIHSGELFGTAGKLVVDAIAIILVVLCITGVLYWLLPKWRKGNRAVRVSYLLHDRVGRYTIALTLFLCITGWCLRPPVMIALVKSKLPTLPGTTLRSNNPWNDKLRMLRHDDMMGDWLLSTSDGFYALANLSAVPQKITKAPPVSVMGLNVLQRDEAGRWLCGSFSGMFVWDRQVERGKKKEERGERREEREMSYFQEGAKSKDDQQSRSFLSHLSAKMPIGENAVSGYSCDFHGKPFTVDYYKGTQAIPQPESLNDLPMSLWNVALEVHSGRIYMGTLATFVFVFLAGILCVWCLWSGYRLRRIRR